MMVADYRRWSTSVGYVLITCQLRIFILSPINGSIRIMVTNWSLQGLLVNIILKRTMIGNIFFILIRISSSNTTITRCFGLLHSIIKKFILKLIKLVTFGFFLKTRSFKWILHKTALWGWFLANHWILHIQ
jgi:hypothetical protein